MFDPSRGLNYDRLRRKPAQPEQATAPTPGIGTPLPQGNTLDTLGAPKALADAGLMKRDPRTSQINGPYTNPQPASLPLSGGGGGGGEGAMPSAVDMKKQFDPVVANTPNLMRATAIQSNGGVIRGQGIGGDEDLRRAMIEAQYGAGKGSPSMRRAIMDNYMAGQNRQADADLATQKMQGDSVMRAQELNMNSENATNERALKASGANAELLEKRRAATAGPSLKERIEILGKMQDMQIKAAEQARKGEEFDAGIGAKENAEVRGRIDALVKGGMDPTAARAQVLGTKIMAGDNLENFDEGRAYLGEQSETLRKRFAEEDGSVAGWFKDAFTGRSMGFGDDSGIDPKASLDVDSIQYREPGGIGGAVNAVRGLFGGSKVLVGEYPKGAKDGMDVPHFYTTDDDPSYQEQMIRRRQIPSGR